MTAQQQKQQVQPQQQKTPAPQANGNGGKLITFTDKVNTFRGLLGRMEQQLAMALPKHIKVDRLIRIVLTEVQKTPKLLDCTQGSLLGAVMQSAQLGLEPGGVLGQAYLVPYRNKGTLECSLIPGYKGLVKLAYQSGEVGAIRARVVREKDQFEYEYGIDEVLRHVPYRGEDAGEMVAVYAVAKIKGVDEAQFLVLERWEVEQIREKFSKAAQSGPWVTDFDEMAKKSALRRLCKLLPASVENQQLARAVVLDEHAEAGLKQEFENVIDVQATAVSERAVEAETEKPKTDLDELAEAARAKKAEGDGPEIT